MSALVRTVVSAAILVASAAASAAPVELLANGDFSAGLTGWSIANQAGGNGNWNLSTVGAHTPTSNHATNGTGGSGNYAVTDQGGPGQPCAVPELHRRRWRVIGDRVLQHVRE